MDTEACKPPDSGEAQNVFRRIRTIMDRMEAAAEGGPYEIKTDVDRVENDLVCLRDDLILGLRRHPERSGLRPILEKVNVVLSLIVGIGYPGSGIHGQKLIQARDALLGIVPDEQGSGFHSAAADPR